MISNRILFLLFLFIFVSSGFNLAYAGDEAIIKKYDRSYKKSLAIFRMGIISRNKTGPSLGLMVGENFDKYVTACIGVVYDNNNETKAYEMVIGIKGYPVPKNISPLVYYEMGYASRHGRWGRPDENGWVINIGSGLKICDSTGTYYLFEIGYKAFTDSFDIGSGDTNYEDNFVATFSAGL